MALGKEWNCQASSDFSDCHIGGAVEEGVGGVPQQTRPAFQLFQILFVVGIVHFDQTVSRVTFDQSLVVLGIDQLPQHVHVYENQKHHLFGVALACLETVGLQVEIVLDEFDLLSL